MAAKHLNREELKKDEVVETINTLVDDFNQHRTAILATVGILVLIIAVWMTLDRRGEAAAIENNQIFTEAHEAMVMARNADDEEVRQTSIQTAVDTLQTLVDKRGDTPAGLHALYLQGNCYYVIGDYAKAAEMYEKFIDASDSGADEARGNIAIGQTLESQSFTDNDPALLDSALERYTRAVSAAKPDSYLHYQALLNQGRVLELQENDEEALAVYKKIVEQRRSPREDIPGATDEKDSAIETGNVFMDTLFEDAVVGASQLSFAAEAQARIDRIEAGTKLRQVPAEAS